MPAFAPSRPLTQVHRLAASAWLGLRSSAQFAERLITESHVRVRGEVRGLLAFCFHAIAPRRELGALDRLVDPELSVSTETFAEFVESFRNHGYRFVTPDDVLRGLEPGHPYALISFDDGYRNNLEILPVLRRFGVPATIFISTNHVAEQRTYWWDAIYAERMRRGTSLTSILAEVQHLKQFRHELIEAHVVKEFGAAALTPREDLVRPMTVEELQTLSREPLVHLGNHTTDHAILTNYSGAALQAQLQGAQTALTAWTGRAPVAVAYPNGNHSPAVVDAAEHAGIRLGLTVEPHRNRVPVPSDRMLTLSRFLAPRHKLIASDYLPFRSAISMRHVAEMAGIIKLRRWMRQ